MFADYLRAVQQIHCTRRIGHVREITGLAIESCGPHAEVGEVCRVMSQARDGEMSQESFLAEVVGIKPGRVTLMAYGNLRGVSSGCEVIAEGTNSSIGVGPGLLGRVIDCFGMPLDELPSPVIEARRSLKAPPINPMQRPRISEVLETGVRSIDALLTLGRGQRVGIFAGSGVGKSTLLGMIARHAQADINVIALIGERGREVKEFIEKQLGPEGLKRSVVVVATSDQPALARQRAVYAAMAIAEYFRDQGLHVLFTMDSVTRFAMARREIGLTAGEPPTARGYTPSVFADIPELCERCGTAPSGGAISALFTVLVEGDDFNEPISDCLRATLDGHIVLTRQLAHQGQYPAIDVLKSASRLMGDLANEKQRDLASIAVKTLGLLDRNRQLIDIGAYERGSNPELDRVLAMEPGLLSFLKQKEGGVRRDDSLQVLAQVLGAES